MKKIRLNPQTKEYLQASQATRRAILKKQYLAGRFGVSEQERALGHLNHLIEFTRRLNLIECKANNGQKVPKASAIRKTDLFLSVEVCAEAVRDDSFLQREEEFRRCWRAFDNLLYQVKSKNNADEYFEAAYLLLYLAALILRRYIAEGGIELEPQILSDKGYLAVAARFARPLFGSLESPTAQLQNLVDNLQELAHA